MSPRAGGNQSQPTEGYSAINVDRLNRLQRLLSLEQIIPPATIGLSFGPDVRRDTRTFEITPDVGPQNFFFVNQPLNDHFP
jgi:hypothetical protein